MAPFGAVIALISVLAMQAGAQNDLVCFPGSNPQKCCNVANSHNGADKSFARAKVSVHEPVEPSVEPRHRVNVNLTYFDTFAGPPAGKWTPITWKDLWLAHGRKLHVVLIGEDRDTFIHVHPDDYAVIADDETSFDVYVSFPRSGKYLVLIDYVLISEDLEMCIDEEAAHAHSSNGKTAVNIANKVTIEVTGAGPAMVPSAVYDTYKYRTTPASDQEAKDKYTLPVNIASFEEECCEDKAGCYEIELVITSHAGMDHGRRRAWNPSGNLGGDFLVVNTSECLMVDAIVKDAVTKEPIRTMTPYLNAAAHMVLVPEDPTAKPIHMHGMLPEDMAAVMTMESMMTCSHIDASAFDEEKEYVFGPVVQSMVAIFNPGPYSLYVTFAIGDKIVNTRFQILAGKAVDGVEGGAWELPEGLCMTSPSSCGMAPPEVDPSCAAKVADAQASLYAPLNFATGAPVVADTSAPTAAPTAAPVAADTSAPTAAPTGAPVAAPAPTSAAAHLAGSVVAVVLALFALLA